MRAWTIVVTLVMGTALLLCGCGGGGGGEGVAPAGGGELSVKVTFPAEKVIPTGTNSLLLTVTDPVTGRLLMPAHVVLRPESDPSGKTEETVTARLGPIRAGPVLLHATAHASTDASGPELAKATVGVNILAGKLVQVGMVLFGVAARVDVIPDTIDLLTTKRRLATAAAFDAIGNIIIGAQFTWASSAPGVASVAEPKGPVEVTGISPGAATLTATEVREGVSGDCAVTVTLREPVRVEVTPARAVVKMEESTRYVARALDADGDEIVDQAFDWNTNNHTIATVDTTGLVTGVAGGTTDVIASAAMGAAGKTPSGWVGTAVVDVVMYWVTLRWEGPAVLDLHAFGPNYDHASPFSPDMAQGSIVMPGAAPASAPANFETGPHYYAGYLPIQGAYYFAVNYRSGSGPVTAVVSIRGVGQQPFVRSYELTEPNGNTGYPVRRDTASWFRPGDVYIGTSGIVVAQPDTTVSLYDSAP